MSERVRDVLDRYFDFEADPWQDHDAACPAPEDIWRLHRDLKAAIAADRPNLALTRLRNRMIDAFVDEFEHDRIQPGAFDRLLRVAKADLETDEGADDE